eukprot:9500133-Pyramimonas_sp.AAC.1
MGWVTAKSAAGRPQLLAAKLAQRVHDATIIEQGELSGVPSRDDPSEPRSSREPFLAPELLEDLNDGLQHGPPRQSRNPLPISKASKQHIPNRLV